MMQDYRLILFRQYNMKLVTLAVAVTLLSGCQSIWPDYMRPKVAVPATYSEATAVTDDTTNSQISATWWTLYQDPILNDLVAKARLNNTDIQLAVARIEEADALMREVGAALLPQIDLDAAATRSRVTEAGSNPVFSG